MQHPPERIEQEIRGADVTIHIEPCRVEPCPGKEQCPVEKTRLEEPDGEGEEKAE